MNTQNLTEPEGAFKARRRCLLLPSLFSWSMSEFEFEFGRERKGVVKVKV